MKIRFFSIAQSELDDAFDWYEEQAIGLGYDFLKALNVTLRLIASYPELQPVVSRNIRRCLLNRFPYALYYGIANNEIFVVAVAHLRRKPNYWCDRLEE